MKKQYKKITAKTKRIPFFFSCLLPLISCFLLLAACAKKMLPPSPDRFAPHLQEIEPINRIKLDLLFDEEINTSKLTTESFVITNTLSETLPIRTISRGKTGNTIFLFTEPTKSTQYFISGIFEDRSGNFGNVNNKKFKASLITDTFPPKITSISPNIGATKKKKNIIIDFGFSEPIDTSSAINFLILPLAKNKITPTWSSDWQSLTFSYPESLLPHTNVYFILMPTVNDLENNRIKDYGYTFFTSDSSLAPILISGHLYYENQPYKNGIVLFANETTNALTLSDITGKFSTRLDSSIYYITAIADTNLDNKVDLLAELKNFNSQDTALIKLNLEAVIESKEIDQYFH